MTVYVDDVVAWLRGREWLVQSGFMPRYHAVLCDPPYGLAFMGQHWDTMTAEQYQAWCTEWATLLLSFVYPGAVLLAFGGTRTYHRLAAGLEDAGWDVFDSMVWLYGSGFPKSHDVSKALDREAGAEREVVGEDSRPRYDSAYAKWDKEYEKRSKNFGQGEWNITAPATPAAARWHGYGTALKPAFEPIVLARAPRGAHTFAALAREFGTGALNVDGGRIQFANNEPYSIDERCRPNTRGTRRKPSVVDYVHEIAAVNVSALGRWPANVILGCACAGDEHDADCPVRVLGEQSGESGHSHWPQSDANVFGTIAGQERKYDGAGTYDNIPGTAARFFYTAKAAAWEREAGLGAFEHGLLRTYGDTGAHPNAKPNPQAAIPRRNAHPTVKPVRLTEYLARLILPPALPQPRRLLVPFAGSGSEMIGAHLAGWDVVDGIEQSAEYADIARARLAWWSQFSSYEQAQSAAGADEREAAEREQARALGVEQLALFDSGGETWYTGGD